MTKKKNYTGYYKIPEEELKKGKKYWDKHFSKFGRSYTNADAVMRQAMGIPKKKHDMK